MENDPDGPPFFGLPQHSPYTIEGRIEQAGSFARGMRRLSTGKQAAVLAVVVLIFVVPWVIFLVAMLANSD